MQANPQRLLDIIRGAYEGGVVVPEFQRPFVWSREDIEELLVSILQGYFIGTFLMLDTSPKESLFPFRTVEGLSEVNPNASPYNHSKVQLVLDGQQRITSLFYALYEPPIPLRNAKHPYRFYFLLEPALEGNVEDSVIGVSDADERHKKEINELIQNDRAIPFSLMKESSQFYLWLYKKQQFLKSEEKINCIQSFYSQFEKFMIPVVTLSIETSKDDIINIFERINRTGVMLSLFDLAAARLYRKEIRLRDSRGRDGLWDKLCRNYPEVAKVIRPEFLLKVITIWQGKEPKKGKLLEMIDELDKENFEQQWRKAADFIVKAYKRVTDDKSGYGAFRSELIPYTTMLVPLAVLLETIENQKGGEEMYRKLDKWYWASVFTQRYDSAVDTKAYQDVVQVRRWLRGGEPPEWLANLSIDSIDVDTDEQRSAIYRGLMCLIVLEGAKDFINGQSANLNECQDDHIFPRAKFGKEEKIDSILNRTLISAQSNRIKSDKKPSEYLSSFLQQHYNSNEDHLLKTLQSHLISREAYEAMKCDNFQAFIKARRQAFIQKIQEKLKD
jgi:hypothetical protein